MRLAPEMAHRIRDEISIIQTATDYLINDNTIPDDARDKIALLKGHLGSIAGLARQFLIITGNETNQLKVLDVGDVISQLVSLLQWLAGERTQSHSVASPTTSYSTTPFSLPRSYHSEISDLSAYTRSFPPEIKVLRRSVEPASNSGHAAQLPAFVV